MLSLVRILYNIDNVNLHGKIDFSNRLEKKYVNREIKCYNMSTL